MAKDNRKISWMFRIFDKPKTAFFLFCLLVLSTPFCQASERLDKSKYISIDEIQPGMEAYCLTVYKGTEIEKFSLEVLDVVRNISPGRDAILVQGKDERFIHTGPVAGCSGSPVYIDGRLAGALAFAWTFSKDPLYGVTPIEEMLRVGEGQADTEKGVREAGIVFDFSKPIDFAEVDRQITAPRSPRRNSVTGATELPCPLITSGLSEQVCEQLSTLVEPFGFVTVAGIGGGSSLSQATSGERQVTKLVPGACLVVPLMTGDISMEAVGTVTEVVDNKVYGFGHSYFGHGAVDLPMATGQVHTVVSSIIRSFKFASSLEIVGALTTDESAAVIGRIGAEADMIPLTIKVDRYNDVEKRLYNCQVVNNRLITPGLIRVAIAGAALMLGSLPPDNMIEYKVNIGLEGAESITFENISTGMRLDEMLMESAGSIALLMNNPYKKVDIKSIDVNVRELAKNIVSHIWSVELSDSKVKAGETVNVSVVVESFLAGKKRYQCSLTVPQNLAPGRYNLIIAGGYGYQEFLRETVPHRFIAQNLTDLVEALNGLLTIERNRLYCLLVLPAGGVTVEKAELPGLPATKVLVLRDAKRTLRAQPYQNWLEDSLETDSVIIDKKVMHITVEK